MELEKKVKSCSSNVYKVINLRCPVSQQPALNRLDALVLTARELDRSTQTCRIFHSRFNSRLHQSRVGSDDTSRRSDDPEHGRQRRSDPEHGDA